MQLARAVAATVAMATSAVLGACAVEPAPLDVPSPSSQGFADRVYPILLAQCAFPACHGSPDRFFAVYGPGRTRFDPATEPYAPATAEELALSYRRTTSMLVWPDGARRSPLLRKPLPVEAGGAGHEGNDGWGQAPFTGEDDPRWITLATWAVGEDGL
ncbi:MAG: hypothetical protein KBG28_16780 [Kofleriaceae bacterium]|jgi:hypothetical protein|nr:hypothetical protein [Kofleriaceae bacterium]